MPSRHSLIAALLVSSPALLYLVYRMLQTKKTKGVKSSISELIGSTPLLKLHSLSKETGCEIFAKVEFLNIGGSPKDRVALECIEQAEEQGLIKPNTGCTIFEGTVGSTGISLATLARSRGYDCHIVMPDDIAQEKYNILQSLGATIEKVRPCSIIDKNHYVNIARLRSAQMNLAAIESESLENGFFCDQFNTTANFDAHFKNTGPEIYEQTGCMIDAFVMGAGTGGTIAGVAAFLTSKIPDIEIVLADPQGSGLYNKVKHGIMYNSMEAEGSRKRHQVDTIVEGIGNNRITDNIGRALRYITDAVTVRDDEAIEMSRYLMQNEGIFAGSSSAVNCIAAYRTAVRLGPGHRVVVMPN